MVVNLISYSNSNLNYCFPLYGTTACSFLNISTLEILILLLHLTITCRRAYCRRCKIGLCLGRVVRTEASLPIVDSVLDFLGKLLPELNSPPQKLIAQLAHSMVGCQALQNTWWKVWSSEYLCVFSNISKNKFILLRIGVNRQYTMSFNTCV